MTHRPPTVPAPALVPALVLALALHAPALAAQSRTTTTTDPLADVTQLYQAREPATTAAGRLRQVHNRTPVDAASIMRQAGYPATAVAGALRTEYAASLTIVYRAMRAAAVPPSEISRAFSDNSFSMDCLDPMGNPMPCGQFGGTEDAPVMGQLSWSPQSQGYTDSLLTITGSAMPEMWVFVGSFELAQVSATSSKLVVRLPAMATSGPLRLKRKQDGANGTLGEFSVVAPPVPWGAWRAAATTAALGEVRDWLAGAKVLASKCVVNAPIALGSAGVLTSDYAFQKKVRSAMMLAGASSAIATGWDDAFTAAWKSWADGTTIPALPLFPALVTVAADVAPPTPTGVIAPVAGFVSTGATDLAPAVLAQRILDGIGAASAPSAERTAAVQAFATDIGTRFAELGLAPVTGLTGQGPVPSHAATRTPGAVANGTCSGVNVLVSALHLFQ